MARLPNQCVHIMRSGVHCGSPAMRQARFCYYHNRQHDERLALEADTARSTRFPQFILPPIQDATSIQASLSKIIRLLAAGQIEHKTASLMLYSLQLATTNLQYAELEKSP
jgi:hypothetical protein